MRGVRISEERLLLDGETIPYRLRRDPRRKRLCMMVERDAAVELRVPTRTGRREIEHFIRGNEGWLRERLEIARRAWAARAPLESGRRLPLLDEELELSTRPAQRNRVLRRDSTLLVSYSAEEMVEPLLERWYRREARRHLGARVEALSERMGLHPSAITIRGQRTRWGSCSSAGRLNFNWRLMFAPTEVVDYVVIHELAHLRHMNHSAEFWALVARFDPLYLEHRKRLKQVSLPL